MPIIGMQVSSDLMPPLEKQKITYECVFAQRWEDNTTHYTYTHTLNSEIILIACNWRQSVTSMHIVNVVIIHKHDTSS